VARGGAPAAAGGPMGADGQAAGPWEAAGGKGRASRGSAVIQEFAVKKLGKRKKHRLEWATV
jgi:hypothetical protein